MDISTKNNNIIFLVVIAIIIIVVLILIYEVTAKWNYTEKFTAFSEYQPISNDHIYATNLVNTRELGETNLNEANLSNAQLRGGEEEAESVICTYINGINSQTSSNKLSKSFYNKYQELDCTCIDPEMNSPTINDDKWPEDECIDDFFRIPQDLTNTNIADEDASTYANTVASFSEEDC